MKKFIESCVWCVLIPILLLGFLSKAVWICLMYYIIGPIEDAIISVFRNNSKGDYNTRESYNDYDEKFDPVEQTLEYKKVERAVEREIDLRLMWESRNKMGSCYRYWDVKKDILKKKYEIDWRSPAELNPGNRYD